MITDSSPSTESNPIAETKVSIKDHPQRELIVALAKAIHASDTKKHRKGVNAREYLLQALHMFEDPTSEITFALRTPPPVVPDIAVAPVAPLPDKLTHAEVLKRPAKSAVAVTPAALKITPNTWGLASATHKGTKPSRVYSKIPDTCTRDLLPYRLNTVLLQKDIEESIVATTGGPLLDHIKLQCAYWSTNGQFIILQFRSPLNDSDHNIFEKVFSHFYEQDVSIKDFIRKNITSSVKWTSVPRFDANHEPISRQRLLEQVKDHPRFSKLDFVALPEFIGGPDRSQDLYGTVKVVFRDDSNGSALATVLSKTVFLNGQFHRTLPWTIKPAIPQCVTCLCWGHHITACKSLSPFCDRCSGPHLSHLHDHHVKHREVNSALPDIRCINCSAAGKDDNHRASDYSCPFYKARFSRVKLTKLLDLIRERQKAGVYSPFKISPRAGDARPMRLTEEEFLCQMAQSMPTGQQVKAGGTLDISYAEKIRILEANKAKKASTSKGKRCA